MARGATDRLPKVLATTGAVLLLWAVYLTFAALPAAAEGSCADDAGTTTCHFGETGTEETFSVP